MLRGRLLSCAPVITGLALAAPAAAAEPVALLRQAMRLPCEAAAGADLRTLAAGLPLAGTTTVSVRFSRVGIVGRRLVLEGAPQAKLLPYRYPRGAMDRMALLIADAGAQGARLANVSLVSRVRAEWRAFEDAAARHPEILFVIAAGNWGRDIEEQPVYPAALGLDNAIVVTSAGADSRLTPGVNWGRRAVDLMVPAENVMALHVDGERRPVSGSSYAAARISGFAACLLADHPDWSTAELKAAILAAADPGREPHRTAHGFISDAILANRGACGNHRPARLAHDP